MEGIGLKESSWNRGEGWVLDTSWTFRFNQRAAVLGNHQILRDAHVVLFRIAPIFIELHG
jgi:hypothetical protein